MDRWTNGSVERFIALRKRPIQNLEPAENLVKSSKSTKASCVTYQKVQKKTIKTSKKKERHR